MDLLSFFLHRYAMLLSDAVAELLPTFKTKDTTAKDALDVFIEHRLRMAAENREQREGGDMMDEAEVRAEIESQFPPDLLRRFEVYLKPRTSTTIAPIRELRADQVCELQMRFSHVEF